MGRLWVQAPLPFINDSFFLFLLLFTILPFLVPCVVSLSTVDDQVPAIRYSPGWVRFIKAAESLNNTLSATLNGTLSFTFTGTSQIFIQCNSTIPSAFLSISIDGVPIPVEYNVTDLSTAPSLASCASMRVNQTGAEHKFSLTVLPVGNLVFIDSFILLAKSQISPSPQNSSNSSRNSSSLPTPSSDPGNGGNSASGNGPPSANKAAIIFSIASSLLLLSGIIGCILLRAKRRKLARRSSFMSKDASTSINVIPKCAQQRWRIFSRKGRHGDTDRGQRVVFDKIMVGDVGKGINRERLSLSSSPVIQDHDSIAPSQASTVNMTIMTATTKSRTEIKARIPGAVSDSGIKYHRNPSRANGVTGASRDVQSPGGHSHHKSIPSAKPAFPLTGSPLPVPPVPPMDLHLPPIRPTLPAQDVSVESDGVGLIRSSPRSYYAPARDLPLPPGALPAVPFSLRPGCSVPSTALTTTFPIHTILPTTPVSGGSYSSSNSKWSSHRTSWHPNISPPSPLPSIRALKIQKKAWVNSGSWMNGSIPDIEPKAPPAGIPRGVDIDDEPELEGSFSEIRAKHASDPALYRRLGDLALDKVSIAKRDLEQWR